MSTFLKRQNDKYWLNLQYVQTNVKAKIGIGKPIYIRFYANYDKTHPELPINFDFDQFDEKKSKEEYCLKTLYRMFDFIQKNHMIDIVWIWATFVEDDDGKLFLFEATNIVVKELPVLHDKKKKEKEANELDQGAWSFMVN